MNTSPRLRPKGNPVGAALMDAQFERFYPGLYANPRWPTTDHVIPWQLFMLYYAAMWAILAQERLSQARAIGLGLGGDAAASVRNAELREAYP